MDSRDRARRDIIQDDLVGHADTLVASVLTRQMLQVVLG